MNNTVRVSIAVMHVLSAISTPFSTVSTPQHVRKVVLSTSINDEATILLNSIDEFDPQDEYVKEIRAAAQRLAWLASGLLNYASRAGSVPSSAALNFDREFSGTVI